MNTRIKVSLVLLLTLAAAVAYQWLGSASISITSEPTGAVVWIDGRARGKTPINRLALETGQHHLEVTHSYLSPYTEGLSLSGGDHEIREIKLQVGEGTFEFLSNPKGAWVELDGERLPQRTPTQASVPSGEHAIVMGLVERRSVSQTHTVNAGEVKVINLNLNIDPHGSLTLSTRPSNAKVEFVNEKIRYQRGVRVPIGEYALKVSRPGYRTETLRYRVRYGENRYSVDLRRDYGTVNVTYSPADAQVDVTYADAGRTFRKAYTQAMEVPVGAVEVRARAIGYRTVVRKLFLENAGATIRLNLQPMQVEIGAVFADAFTGGSVGPEMVVIPAGHFVTGNAAGPVSERPTRMVTLTQPFAVSRFEITVGDYRKFTLATGRAWPARVDQAETDHAMGYVSFKDAQAYAAWVSAQTGHKYRLLSEAEWEYVARAGTGGAYFFGQDKQALCDYANIADATASRLYADWDTLDCDDQLLRVGATGTLKPNPFGLYDIYGNVAEWVLDCGMPEYQDAPTDGSPAEQGLGCSTHGFRGGSWDSGAAEAASAYRNAASRASDDRGIRLLREL